MSSLTTAQEVMERIYRSATPTRFAIAVPSLGMVSVPWHNRIIMLGIPMNTQHCRMFVVGKPVDKARNELVKAALESNCSHVFFIDDDVLIPPDALIRLHAHKRDIVGGVYFTKDDTCSTPLIMRGMGEGVFEPDWDWTPGDVVECRAIGMGCTLIRREVFERMRAEVPVDEDGTPQWFVTRINERIDGSFISQTEDVDFCSKAVALGYTVACDTGVWCWHWDQAKQQGYPPVKWAKHVEEMKAA